MSSRLVEQWSAVVVAVLTGAMLGCATQAPADDVARSAGGAPIAGVPGTAPALESSTGFSATRAFGHLEALVGIGPRPVGSDGIVAARSYIQGELEALGLDVETHDATFDDTKGTIYSLANLSARVPGTGSTGHIVLAAPLDTARAETFEAVGANEGASGPALLLEVAHRLQQEPLPYDVTLVFLDGERIESGRFIGSELLLTHVTEEPRLLVYLDQVADSDLEIHRDLWSYRMFRQSFFRAAERLGHDAAFSSTAGFDQPVAGHRVWFDAGWRRVVALADIRFGGDEPPGTYWRTAEDDLDHVSAESLGVVGNVVIEGLRNITAHLSRVDAHVTPLPTPDERPEAPEIEIVPVVTEPAEDAAEVQAAPTPDPGD